MCEGTLKFKSLFTNNSIIKYLKKMSKFIPPVSIIVLITIILCSHSFPPQNNCVFIRIPKRKGDENINNEKKFIMEQEDGQEITENENFMFDEDDLIVYSPEPYVDENYQDPDPINLFLQNANCYQTSPELPQCRECTKDIECDKYSCRFYDFRKIEKGPDGTHRAAGFLDPHVDPSVDGKLVLLLTRISK